MILNAKIIAAQHLGFTVKHVQVSASAVAKSGHHITAALGEHLFIVNSCSRKVTIDANGAHKT